MIVKDPKIYDMVKQLALLVLPILGALYFGLAGLLGLPSAENVVGIIVVIDAFLGVVLYVSSILYDSENVGNIVTTETLSGKTYSLEIEGDPELIETHDEVRFKVVGAKTPKLALVRNRKRAGEEGLSLVEALIVLLIAALILGAIFLL